MNRNNIDTNFLYSGKEILNFAINNIFEEGDRLIAIQEDVISKYTYRKNPNGTFDFSDEEHNNAPLDMFDLVNCKFIIMFDDNSKNFISVASVIGAFDTDLFIKNHNEIMKKWFRGGCM